MFEVFSPSLSQLSVGSTFLLLSLLFVSFPDPFSENGKFRPGAAQRQLDLPAAVVQRAELERGRGGRGPRPLCVSPAQTHLHAPGGALQPRGLVQPGLRGLLPDGHRLPAALELLHNSQGLLDVQAGQWQRPRWAAAFRHHCESEGGSEF